MCHVQTEVDEHMLIYERDVLFTTNLRRLIKIATEKILFIPYRYSLTDKPT